jgi:hypothetical protein
VDGRDMRSEVLLGLIFCNTGHTSVGAEDPIGTKECLAEGS